MPTICTHVGYWRRNMTKDPIIDNLHKIRQDIILDCEKQGISLTRFFEEYEKTLNKPLVRPGDLKKRKRKSAA